MASLAKVILTQDEALDRLSRNAFGELQKGYFGLTGAIGNGVNKATDNVSFPFRTVLYLANNNPKLKSELIGAYDSVVNACKKKATKELLESNSESTKIKMGSLLRGLCYLITPTQVLGVATANSSIFGSVFSAINIPTTLEKDCLWGQILETKTLDDTYTEYSLHRTVKGVTINNIKADDVFVIPYNEFISVMAIIENLLKSGKVLRILTEAAGGRHKESFYTRDPRVLSAFSDDEEYFKTNKVNTLVAPFKGFVYEPKIGVSTLKSIVGRIDIDKISKIEVVTAQNQITVNKASKTEAIEREKLQTCISNALAQKRIEDPAAQEQLINSIPGAKELFGSDIKLVYERTYMLNDLFEDYDIAKLRKVVTALGAAEEYMQMSSIISENYKDIPVAGMTKDAFDTLLKQGVYRVTYRYSSSAKLSIRYVTKNKDYLKLCYGNDYERYGSDFDLGVRASKEPNLKSIAPEELCKKYYQAPEAVDNIKQYFIDGTIQRGAGKSFLDGIDFCLNPPKEKDETNNVRAFRMFSPKTREKDGRIKIESFTEFIDYTRVVKIIKLK